MKPEKDTLTPAARSSGGFQEKAEQLKELTRQEMERLGVPGAAVGLTVDGADYCFGLGVTSVENPLEVTPQTLFRIGSITKTHTATLLFSLIEQGKVALDDPVRN
ncbi:MAG: serine hydrolase domain-containing protein, partial [Anaerolineaceae bacterium]